MDQRDAGAARQPENHPHPARSSDVTVAAPAPAIEEQAADTLPWTWPTEGSYPATNGPPGIPVPASDADALYWPAWEAYGPATVAPPEQETATPWGAPQHQPATPEHYDPPSAQDADAAWAAYWAAQEQNAEPAPGTYESAAPPYVPVAPADAAGSRGNAPIVLFIIAAAVLGGAILALAGYLLFGRSSTPGATPTAGAVAAPPTTPATVAPTAVVVATATRAATAASAPSASAATAPATAPLAVPTNVPGSTTPAAPPATPVALPLAIPVVLPPTAEPTIDLPPEPTEAPLPPAPAPAPVFIPPAPVVNNPPPPTQPTPVPTVAPAPPTAPAPTKPPPPAPTTPPQPVATKPPTSGARPVPTVPPGFIPPYAPRPITTPIGG